MTDEQMVEIIKKHLVYAQSENIILFDEPETFKPVLAAMREAVEKGSIEFARWTRKNRWVTDSEGWWTAIDGLAIPGYGFHFEKRTDEQLYQEYLKNK